MHWDAPISGWLKEGKLKYKEDMFVGLENAPRAFIDLLQGKNFGKLIVQVSDEAITIGALTRKSEV